MLSAEIAALISTPITAVHPLAQGAGGIVYRVQRSGQADFVAKVRQDDFLDLRVEAEMLSLLQQHHVPTPEILAVNEKLG